MDISVVVCTYNRAATLARCLARLAAQQVPEGVGWEVVVVDNNSTDHTSRVVEDAAARGLPVRYSRETNQGLCHARNRGIQDTRGAIVAYIDDDILTDPAWLSGMVSAFRETGCDAAGGSIHLETEGRPLPSWLSRDMWGYLGYIDHGEERIVLDGVRHYPHGGNMAFRREVFGKVGGFDVTIGRKGNKLFKQSETEFFHRLVPTGAKIVYEPAARVRHIIKPGELSKSHFRTLQLRHGEQRAGRETAFYPRSVMGVPLFTIPALWRSLGKYLAAAHGEPGPRFRREMDLWELMGYMWGRLMCYRNGRVSEG
jgi:glycosyltransferase involved in cell wall biosynthesis